MHEWQKRAQQIPTTHFHWPYVSSRRHFRYLESVSTDETGRINDINGQIRFLASLSTEGTVRLDERNRQFRYLVSVSNDKTGRFGDRNGHLRLLASASTAETVLCDKNRHVRFYHPFQHTWRAIQIIRIRFQRQEGLSHDRNGLLRFSSFVSIYETSFQDNRNWHLKFVQPFQQSTQTFLTTESGK